MENAHVQNSLVAVKRKAGRPKGTFGKYPKTLAKESLQKEVQLKVQELVLRKAHVLIQAQMIPALGQNFVYRIEKEFDKKGKVISKKHVLVDDPVEIENALDKIEAGGFDSEENFYYITTKEPDFRAIDSLLNRALGKPIETLNVNEHHTFSLRKLQDRRNSLPLKVKAKIIDQSK